MDQWLGVQTGPGWRKQLMSGLRLLFRLASVVMGALGVFLLVGAGVSVDMFWGIIYLIISYHFWYHWDPDSESKKK